MNMDNLGYRYSRQELETLRLILRLDVPIGVDPVKIDKSVYDACVDSLCVAGLMIDAGETAMIDPVTMLLMRQAAQSDLCLRIRSEGRHTLLHRTPDMFLLSECTLASCTLMPLKNLHEVQEPLKQAFSRHGLPAHFELFDSGMMESTEAEAPERASAVFAEIFMRFRIRCTQ